MTGYDELVTNARSVLKITPRAVGDLNQGAVVPEAFVLETLRAGPLAGRVAVVSGGGRGVSADAFTDLMEGPW